LSAVVILYSTEQSGMAILKAVSNHSANGHQGPTRRAGFIRTGPMQGATVVHDRLTSQCRARHSLSGINIVRYQTTAMNVVGSNSAEMGLLYVMHTTALRRRRVESQPYAGAIIGRGMIRGVLVPGGFATTCGFEEYARPTEETGFLNTQKAGDDHAG